jgi:hypothetical protein
MLPEKRYLSIPSVFEKAGFVEAARRSKSRPIMRYYTAHANKQWRFVVVLEEPSQQLLMPVPAKRPV